MCERGTTGDFPRYIPLYSIVNLAEMYMAATLTKTVGLHQPGSLFYSLTYSYCGY